jgi:hypothetical protein
MCEECLAKCMKELDADAGNEAGSASSPGPASHDTMGSRHRRPGDPSSAAQRLCARTPPPGPEIVTSVTPEGLAGTWEIERDADGNQVGRRAVTAAERRALLAPGWEG